MPPEGMAFGVLKKLDVLYETIDRLIDIKGRLVFTSDGRTPVQIHKRKRWTPAS